MQQTDNDAEQAISGQKNEAHRFIFEDLNTAEDAHLVIVSTATPGNPITARNITTRNRTSKWLSQIETKWNYVPHLEMIPWITLGCTGHREPSRKRLEVTRVEINRASMSADDATQQQRMQRDDAIIYRQAQVQRVVFKDVNTNEAAHLVIVSMRGDWTSAKRISAWARTLKWLGYMSDQFQQTLNQACQKAPTGQQGAKVENSRGVRFQNVKIGKGCAITMVSTKGEEVFGKDIKVEDYTSFNSGQMSDQSVQSLPRACSTILYRKPE
ncbi:hypothetical protein V499_02242 [Pseudogymnoascus sp. VKM F-103]|nr:hypothetical protein V499_02242 [Pseudogymnoascus sp. VKM F-103]